MKKIFYFLWDDCLTMVCLFLPCNSLNQSQAFCISFMWPSSPPLPIHSHHLLLGWAPNSIAASTSCPISPQSGVYVVIPLSRFHPTFLSPTVTKPILYIISIPATNRLHCTIFLEFHISALIYHSIVSLSDFLHFVQQVPRIIHLTGSSYSFPVYGRGNIKFDL